ncbi:DMT family transporter [Sneathiella glossodoripedis]|uniref:DMT family transporter n=1 Tax=Sneathiella glossodoripedis TaxID=418853 RepID=UPI0011DCEF20|nr:DMT family transporter [Sneathiella glossodoripedis]
MFKNKAPLYVMVFGSLFGATISFAKLGALNGLDPLTLVFWQMLIGGILLWLTAKVLSQPVRTDIRHTRYYLIAGLLGNAVPTTLAFMASVNIGAALTGLVYPLSPVFTFAFSLLIGIDKASPLKITGMISGLVGAFLIVLPPALDSTSDGTQNISAIWLGLAFLVPIFLGLGNIYRSMDWPTGTKPIPLASGMLIATSLLLLPVLLFSDAQVWPDFNNNIAITVFLGNIVISYVGFIFYFELQRIAAPVYFSQISYFITITTLIFGVLLFGESIKWYMIPSIVLIFAGLYLVSKKQN